jgi:hypothetical protein
MILGLAGVAIGLVLALVRGGRPRHVMGWRLHWPLPMLAAVAVLTASRLGFTGEAGVLVAGALGLLAVALLANLHLPGTGVVAVGVLANLVPVLLVGATPVEVRALQVVGAPADRLAPTQVLADEATPMVVLASRIPVPVAGVVVSFGDLVVMVGLAAVARSLVRSAPRRRIPVRDILDDGPLTLADLEPAGPGVADRRRDEPLVDLTTDPVTHRLGEHPVHVGPGQPVPVPLGWEREDDGVVPSALASLRPRRSRTHPTMRLTPH